MYQIASSCSKISHFRYQQNGVDFFRVCFCVCVHATTIISECQLYILHFFHICSIEFSGCPEKWETESESNSREIHEREEKTESIARYKDWMRTRCQFQFKFPRPNMDIDILPYTPKWSRHLCSLRHFFCLSAASVADSVVSTITLAAFHTKNTTATVDKSLRLAFFQSFVWFFPL